MADAIKKEEPTSEDVDADKVDASNTPDNIKCENVTYRETDVEEEPEENETDEVDMQGQSIEDNDDNMTQTSEDVKIIANEPQTTSNCTKPAKNDVTKTAAAENKFAIDLEISIPARRHPCKHLLENYSPRPYDLTKQKKMEVREVTKDEGVWVETVTHLMKVVKQLMAEKEIGVAIRYNTGHYESRLCLLLISTKEADYMIDGLELDKYLHLLKPVFLNPDIVKVVMEASYVLCNLQTDYKLWFVNIFDLPVAIRKTGANLNYLNYLETRYHVPIKGQKLNYWQTRPLPEEYRRVALTQVHNLLPVYVDVKNQLIDAKLIEPFLTSCNEKCALVYNDRKALENIVANLEFMGPQQVAVMSGLQEWRHQLAKEKDCSVDEVLQNIHIVALAANMRPTPRHIMGQAKSGYVHNHVNQIQKIIQNGLNTRGPINEPQDGVQTNQNTNFIEATGYTRKPVKIKEAQKVQLINYRYTQATKKKYKARLRAQQQEAGSGKKKTEIFKRPEGKLFVSQKAVNSSNAPEEKQGKLFGSQKVLNRGEAPIENHQIPDRRIPSNKRQFMNRDDGPSFKRRKNAPWSKGSSWAKDRSQPPPRPTSPSSYMIDSSQGEAIPIDNGNILANLLANAKSNYQSNASLNPINTLLNMGSTLLNLNTQSNLDDAVYGAVNRNNDGFMPNRYKWQRNGANKPSNERESTCSSGGPSTDVRNMSSMSEMNSHPNRLQSTDMDWSPNQSRRFDGDSYHRSQRYGDDSYPNWSQRYDRDLYRPQRSHDNSYPNMSRRSDEILHPSEFQSSNSQNPGIVAYPTQSRRSHLVNYANQSRDADMVSYPNCSNPNRGWQSDESQNCQVVSYPKYDPSRYSRQGF